MKKNIHKNLRNKFVHFLGIALLMGTMVTTLFLQPMITASAASDITPQYTSDSNGISPTNSWTIPGQNTIINHQGGDTINGWDKNTSWDGDSSDTSKSYLKFGTDTSNPDYQIRKYAKETSTPGLYDVYLNAKGNEVKNIKPIDIVLIVDMSGSMNSSINGGNDRVGAVRQGVKNFLKTINDAGIGKYVNVGVVGFSSPGYISSSGTLSENIDASDNQSHITRINNLLSNEFTGGTFTQLGIRTGQNMLANDGNDHKKMMILLTDGVPTFSYKVTGATTIGGTDYGTTFGTNRDEPGFTSQLWTISGRNRVPSAYNVSGKTIKDTWPATLGESLIAKNKSTELHALGIQLSKDVGYTNNNNDTYLTESEVRDRMKLLASPGFYQDASMASDVTTYLNNQAKDVLSQFKTVNQGSISDPIGSQFIYASGTPTIKSVGSSAVQNLPTVTKSDGSIAVSNMNLGKDQEVQIHYQVHLNTESDNFQPDYWYQMNGKTTFIPTKDGTAVEFGVPSAKALGTQLTVTKKWTELAADSSHRPDNINFEVTRLTNNQSNNWRATGTLSKLDNWTKTFTQLIKNSQSVWLPAYDNNGTTFNYQVASEDTDGYVTSIDNKTTSNSSTITNTQYGLVIDKYQSNSQNKLPGAEFTVRSADGKQTYIVKENQLQLLTPSDYTIQETKSPTGYQLDTTIYKLTLSTDGKWKTSGQQISETSPSVSDKGFQDGFSIDTDESNNADKNNVVHFVKNDVLKNYDFVVSKVDKVTGKSLTGAKFSLISNAGKIINYKETNPTDTFTFESISPGTYILKETAAPEGYIAAKDVKVVIGDDGKVAISNNNGEWYTSLQNDMKNNQLSLTVNNSNKTIFPSTGGSGNGIYLIVGGVFIIIAVLASGYYVFRIKRGYKSW